MNDKKYPNPSIVGEHIDRNTFDDMQRYSATDCGSWVHFKDQTEKVLDGKYHEIKPLVAEFITTHLCNFNCPTCSRRMLRETWLGEDKTWGKNEKELLANRKYSIDLKGMKIVIDKLAKNDVKAIVWGGGEPTLNKDIYDGIIYAKQQGIFCSLITNGVNLNEQGISKLFSNDLDLIRISLNCASREKHAIFHGYLNKDYYDQVLTNIKMVAEYKSTKKISTKYGISVILDNKNIDEINGLVEIIYSIIKKYKKSPIDFIVVRSVCNYYNDYGQINEMTFEEFGSIDVTKAFKKLINYGVDVIIPKTDSLKGKTDCEILVESWKCLGYGWCTEIHPSGDIFLCSDTYGNPEYVIGNLLEQELEEIWCSNKRRIVLEKSNKSMCMAKYCPFTGRGHHLNRIFNQIENMREDKYDQVNDWVSLLKGFTHEKIPFYL